MTSFINRLTWHLCLYSIDANITTTCFLRWPCPSSLFIQDIVFYVVKSDSSSCFSFLNFLHVSWIVYVSLAFHYKLQIYTSAKPNYYFWRFHQWVLEYLMLGTHLNYCHHISAEISINWHQWNQLISNKINNVPTYSLCFHEGWESNRLF